MTLDTAVAATSACQTIQSLYNTLCSEYCVLVLHVHMYVHTQHLERLESECSQFHSAHCEMSDDVKAVAELQDKYHKFLDIIAVSGLQALCSEHCSY